VRYRRGGVGRALLGHPLAALTWLANELAARGSGLRAGDWASCATCMVPLEIEPGDKVLADYGLFGCIDIGLANDDAPHME
jgi:2-keto-4-pentenoate hydratase